MYPDASAVILDQMKFLIWGGFDLLPIRRLPIYELSLLLTEYL